MSRKTLGILGGTLLATALIIGTLGTVSAQQAGPGGPGRGPGGMMGQGNGNGNWDSGPGMMGGDFGGGNWGMGPGMMGGWGATTSPEGKTLSLDDAKQAVESYLNQYGDPNLKIDEVMEFQRNFYAIVEENEPGKGAMELLVNKANGAVFPEYGPNMMWNTKYGHMGGLGGGMMGGGFGGMMGRGFGGMMGGGWGAAPQSQDTITAEKAQSIAQQWLDANQSGSTTEKPDAFYGYYTVHTSKDGKISGMLSVNAYTGQIWYHSWHGSFVAVESGDEAGS